jgi:DNA-binding NtrC family response regulator
MSLRQALTRQGISVSMAWDAKQTADLLAVVRPHVVVIDLELPRWDGYAAVAGLAAATPAPHALIVGGGPQAPNAFAATLRDATHASRAVPLERCLADTLGRTEAAPAVAERKAPARLRAVPVGSR